MQANKGQQFTEYLVVFAVVVVTVVAFMGNLRNAVTTTLSNGIALINAETQCIGTQCSYCGNDICEEFEGESANPTSPDYCPQDCDVTALPAVGYTFWCTPDWSTIACRPDNGICGPGVKTRTVSCLCGPQIPGGSCPAPRPPETITCNEPCPPPGCTWGDWQAGTCNVQCGPGEGTFTRTCNCPDPASTTCAGTNFEERACYMNMGDSGFVCQPGCEVPCCGNYQCDGEESANPALPACNGDPAQGPCYCFEDCVPHCRDDQPVNSYNCNKIGSCSGLCSQTANCAACAGCSPCCGDGVCDEVDESEPQITKIIIFSQCWDGGLDPDTGNQLGTAGADCRCGDGVCISEVEDCSGPPNMQCPADCGTSCCGNGWVGPGEECDFAATPPITSGASCTDYVDPGGNPFTGGTLSCDNNCAIDINGCTWCGNLIPEAGEDCRCPSDVPPPTADHVCLETSSGSGIWQWMLCGNGKDDPGEDCSTCAADFPCAGTEQCLDHDANAATPPECSTCQNGIPDEPGEDCDNCPQDNACAANEQCIDPENDGTYSCVPTCNDDDDCDAGETTTVRRIAVFLSQGAMCPIQAMIVIAVQPIAAYLET